MLSAKAGLNETLRQTDMCTISIETAALRIANRSLQNKAILTCTQPKQLEILYNNGGLLMNHQNDQQLPNSTKGYTSNLVFKTNRE